MAEMTRSERSAARDMRSGSKNHPPEVPAAASRGTVLLFAAPGRDVENFRNAIDHSGFNLYVAENRDRLKDAISEQRPDLVVLDQQLAMAPLAAVQREIVEAKTTETLPIIVLTDETSDLPKLVELRPDACMSEVYLVVRATLRRERPAALGELRSASIFDLDETKFQLSISDRHVSLTKSEFCLLGPFFDAPDVVFDRVFLEKLAFNTAHYSHGNRLVDFYLSRMRRRLKSSLGADPIRSVRGKGYTLADC